MLRLRRRTYLHLILVFVLLWVCSLLYIAFHNRRSQRQESEDPGDDLGDRHEGRHPKLGPRDEARWYEDDVDLNKEQIQVQWEQRQFVGEANHSNVRGFTTEDEFIHFENELKPRTDLDYLVEKGLIIPKWNIDTEVPEHPNDPGENGQAVIIDKKTLSEQERKKFDIGWEANYFNEYGSDRMSVHRSLPDARDPECRQLKYRDTLPDTSVIIIFHNEAWKALLRTVHSVLDRSPPHLVKEIILVDDFSTHDHLKERLDDYMAQLGKVKILRAEKREGLIRARIMGAAVATGEVLTFLDSHCECTLGWLEPLLNRIAANKSNVVTPVIDAIIDTTLAYKFQEARSTNLGGFDWNLKFNWHAIPERIQRKRTSDVEPVESPTMAGGLFSINREYFEYIGSYDSGMDFWGGENLEISFRIWMCGGRLETVICSHVGHIFRKRTPNSWTGRMHSNSARLAFVWMDEFGKYYFDKVGHNLGDYGNIDQRKKLRMDLKCKSFAWYLKNVFPELFISGETLAAGPIRNKVQSSDLKSLCIEASTEKPLKGSRIGIASCREHYANQGWFLSVAGEVRRDDACFDFPGTFAVTYVCHGLKGNQEWSYNMDNTIRHTTSNLCLTLSKDTSSLHMGPCIGTDHQIWYWDRRTPDSEQKRLGLPAMPLPR